MLIDMFGMWGVAKPIPLRIFQNVPMLIEVLELDFNVPLFNCFFSVAQSTIFPVSNSMMFSPPFLLLPIFLNF